jgi:hypothetical protein
LGCQLAPHRLTVPKPELNKVHYEVHVPTIRDRVVKIGDAKMYLSGLDGNSVNIRYDVDAQIKTDLRLEAAWHFVRSRAVRAC